MMRCCHRLLWYDIKHGILRNWLFLLAPICALFLFRECRYALFLTGTKGTWAVYIMYLLRGPAMGDFYFSFLWLLVLLIPLFITIQYPFKDMERYGMHLLLRSGRRRNWWLSKCGWNFLCTLVYLLLLYGTMAICCAVHGIPVTLGTPRAAVTGLFGDLISVSDPVLGTGKTIFVVLILPLLALADLSMVEMFLSLILRPIYGFLLTVLLIAMTAYFSTPFLFLNFADLTRSGALLKNGLDIYVGLAVCLIVLVGLAAAGAAIFRRRDILSDRKEL
ncbi:MAG: hypothetical protein LUC41_06475 [Clostridiales bacterium]|nr:hypothetical protein [Clostridiales bacterium]